jgi:hypothetical protein
MADEPLFRVETATDRVVLVPEFWPSELAESTRRHYDALRSVHRTEDGALSIPRSDLHGLSPEPGSVVSVEDVWLARERRAEHAYNGFVFPDHGLDALKERIAAELMEE